MALNSPLDTFSDGTAALRGAFPASFVRLPERSSIAGAPTTFVETEIPYARASFGQSFTTTSFPRDSRHRDRTVTCDGKSVALQRHLFVTGRSDDRGIFSPPSMQHSSRTLSVNGVWKFKAERLLDKTK
ncbi:hypothetical protein ZHAS_00004693 [Anopheles sinensis]|uniref:Uncharacterized protein n=1 Tax=Anopheles sinensis TaxID=74873 RepID=A0A084VHF0_ANOSI|nr:hypothetical protein ZHAS_00004693 [Anopheles sinensis]